MSHAKSLRVIGQSLENAKLPAFELDTDGIDYVVRSDSLTRTAEWILRQAIGEMELTEQSSLTVNRPLRFTQVVISRLDSDARKQRRNHASPQTQGSNKLSQLLRSLGDHIERTEIGAFHVSWTPHSVSINYKKPDGKTDSRTFTPEKLQQLGLHIRFRRSSRSS
jgi:hypothetical protein